MTDEEKIVKIKELLKPVLDWYAVKIKEEEAGEIDGSYIYDTAYEQFDQLSRGQLLGVIEILAKESE